MQTINVTLNKPTGLAIYGEKINDLFAATWKLKIPSFISLVATKGLIVSLAPKLSAGGFEIKTTFSESTETLEIAISLAGGSLGLTLNESTALVQFRIIAEEAGAGEISWITGGYYNSKLEAIQTILDNVNITSQQPQGRLWIQVLPDFSG